MWSVDPETKRVRDVRLVDLQTVSRGIAALDVLYFIKMSCGTAEYDEHLRLLQIYHNALVAAGVASYYSLDALRLDYARCFLATFMWNSAQETKAGHSSDKKMAGSVAYVKRKIAACDSGTKKWRSKPMGDTGLPRIFVGTTDPTC